MQVKLNSENKDLGKPGEGLPWVEQVLMNFFFKLLVRLRSRRYFETLFTKEANLICDLVESKGTDSLESRVVVDRVVGMEDSSRDWSCYMTLEHLNIVNTGVFQLIKSLVNDEDELNEVRIENVKPSCDSGEASWEEFQKVIKLVPRNLKKLKNLNSKNSHKHPWFGELNAFQWSALIALHMGIHRKQIERIIQKIDGHVV